MYVNALEIIQPATDKHKLRITEVALRWMANYNKLSSEYLDAVLIGGSRPSYIEQNILDLEKGPLPDDLITALDDAWELVKPITGKYWH